MAQLIAPGAPLGEGPLTIELEGLGRVQVGRREWEAFTPQQREAAIAEIRSTLPVSQPPQNQVEVTPQQPGMADRFLDALPLGGAMAAEPIVHGIAGTIQGAGEVLDNAAELAQNTLGYPFGADSATRANEAGGGFEGAAAPLDTSGHPSNTVGRVAGNIAPTLLLPGGPFAQGAGAGALLSEADTAGGVARDTLIGGVGGKFGDLAARGVSAVVAPRVTDAARRLHERGIRMTPGQVSPSLRRTEERLTSRPFVGDRIVEGRRQSVRDFNRTAVEDTVAPVNQFLAQSGQRPIRVSGEGHAAIRSAGDQLSGRYERLVPSLQLVPDQALAADVRALGETLASGDMSPAALQRFEQIVRNQVMSRLNGSEPLAGAAYRQIERDLGRQMRRFGRSESPDDQAMVDAFGEVQTMFQRALQRSNPHAAAELQALNEGWANLVIIERAAGGAKGGLFSPLQLRQSVRRGDSRTRGRGMARGEARMQQLAEDASDVLPSSYPDSGTAGRTQMNPLDPRYWIGMGQGALYGQPTQRLLSSALLAPRPSGAEQITKALNFLPAPQAGAAGALSISNPLFGY